jgi:hypothetical protein
MDKVELLRKYGRNEYIRPAANDEYAIPLHIGS